MQIMIDANENIWERRWFVLRRYVEGRVLAKAALSLRETSLQDLICTSTRTRMRLKKSMSSTWTE